MLLSNNIVNNHSTKSSEYIYDLTGFPSPLITIGLLSKQFWIKFPIA
jgi:hypothetical protein